MSSLTPEDVFRSLIQAKTNSEVRSILAALGDAESLGLSQPFGNLNFQWRPFGDRSTNISSVGLATRPGRSLTERITNAMDGILEERVQPGVPPPNSVKEAASAWFGRPMTAPDNGLFLWKYGDIDRRISVVLNESEKEDAPTVDVSDDGIGIAPQDFSRTILSLQAENKIKKKYLIGAFGQGGSSTLAFADYTLIASRSRVQQEVIGFTLIRVLRLDDSYKEDCYAYLVVPADTDSLGQVPSFSLPKNDSSFEIYPSIDGMKLPSFKKGTFIRHYSYKLDGLSKTLSPAPGNLWHHLQGLLFDPLLPFRLIDLRPADQDKKKDEVIKGSRNRLMALVAAKDAAKDEADSGTACQLHRPMEYVRPYGATTECVGIEYWVVFNQRLVKGKPTLRNHSNELYVQRNFPIVVTLNGQNQGEMGAKLIKDVGLNLLSAYMIIHIDASRVDGKIRRELFSTSREGLKEGPVLTSLHQVLTAMLKEDTELFRLERELTERITQKETKTTRDEVKAKVTKLLLDAGIQVCEKSTINTPGEGETEKEPPGVRPKPRPPVIPIPLPTLPFPEVTKLAIVKPNNEVKIRVGEIVTVKVETDADEEFDRQNRFGIRSESPSLEVASKTNLRGGRISWRLRPIADAVSGTKGRVVVTVTKMDGTQISAEIPYEILPVVQKNTKTEQGLIPHFEVIGITPDEDPTEWSQCDWPDPENGSDELASVAYKTVRMQTGVIVYYSKIFRPYQEQLEKLKGKVSLLQQFSDNYEIWISYHALLQFNAAFPSNIEDDDKDKIQEEDRARVGSMVTKQALNLAELAVKAAKAEAEAET